MKNKIVLISLVVTFFVFLLLFFGSMSICEKIKNDRISNSENSDKSVTIGKINDDGDCYSTSCESENTPVSKINCVYDYKKITRRYQVETCFRPLLSDEADVISKIIQDRAHILDIDVLTNYYISNKEKPSKSICYFDITVFLKFHKSDDEKIDHYFQLLTQVGELSFLEKKNGENPILLPIKNDDVIRVLLSLTTWKGGSHVILGLKSYVSKSIKEKIKKYYEDADYAIILKIDGVKVSGKKGVICKGSVFEEPERKGEQLSLGLTDEYKDVAQCVLESAKMPYKLVPMNS